MTERLEEIADRIDKAGSELIVVPGNHDTMLESLLDEDRRETIGKRAAERSEAFTLESIRPDLLGLYDDLVPGWDPSE